MSSIFVIRSLSKRPQAMRSRSYRAVLRLTDQYCSSWLFEFQQGSSQWEGTCCFAGLFQDQSMTYLCWRRRVALGVGYTVDLGTRLRPLARCHSWVQGPRNIVLYACIFPNPPLSFRCYRGVYQVSCEGEEWRRDGRGERKAPLMNISWTITRDNLPYSRSRNET